MEERIDVPLFDFRNQRNFKVDYHYVLINDIYILHVAHFIAEYRDSEKDYFADEGFAEMEDYSRYFRKRNDFSGVDIEFRDTDEWSCWLVYIHFKGADYIKIPFKTQAESESFAFKIEQWGCK